VVIRRAGREARHRRPEPPAGHEDVRFVRRAARAGRPCRTGRGARYPGFA